MKLTMTTDDGTVVANWDSKEDEDYTLFKVLLQGDETYGFGIGEEDGNAIAADLKTIDEQCG